MTNILNLDLSDVREIEALTADQLKAIRLNLRENYASDEWTREAVAEYVLDGGEIADLLDK